MTDEQRDQRARGRAHVDAACTPRELCRIRGTTRPAASSLSGPGVALAMN